MKSKGFTLIEVIVAVAIFAIIVVSLGLAFNQAIKISSKAKQNMDVAQLINKAVEKMYFQMGSDDTHFTETVFSLPDYTGNELKFGNDEYKVTYTLKRVAADYDLIMELGSNNALTVYKRVYDTANSGIRYEFALIVIPNLNNEVALDVYKEMNISDVAKYCFNGVAIDIQNPTYKIYYKKSYASNMKIKIEGIFKMQSGTLTSDYTNQILEIWSKDFNVSVPAPTASPTGNFITSRPTIKFISAVNSKYYHQLFEVKIELWNLNKNKKVKEYKFITRG